MIKYTNFFLFVEDTTIFVDIAKIDIIFLYSGLMKLQASSAAACEASVCHETRRIGNCKNRSAGIGYVLIY